MKIIYFGKGIRGYKCLKKILEFGYGIDFIVGHENDKPEENPIPALAKRYKIESINPENINNQECEKILRSKQPDVFILGGYGKILKKNILDIPKVMCINLHAGKLPDYRGSSPMNWALINGESFFSLSILKVEVGVDTGPVIYETTHSIGVNDTIADLHRIANDVFPDMLIRVLEQINNSNFTLRKQSTEKGAYYPLRFPDDGFILFDKFTAKQIHNRIRSLTIPYPCAFTFFKGKKVKLISSQLTEVPFYGEPGIIYQKDNRGLLVCAADESLWIKKAVFEDGDVSLIDIATRYEKLATVEGYILNNCKNKLL